jgi:nitrate reductase gamma subunit
MQQMMENKKFVWGLVFLLVGLLSNTLSALNERFTLFGDFTDFMSGFFLGLAGVMFVAAIVALIRSRR